MRRMTWKVALCGLSVVAGLLTSTGSDSSAAASTAVQTPAPTPGQLGTYNINPNEVYVAGVSSGGDMAEQLDVAYSSVFRGAALFATAPYYCAQNNDYQAVYACGYGVAPDDLSQLEADTNYWSSIGWIDPTNNLYGEPVYVFSGTNDNTVVQSVVDDTVSFYQYYGANVTYDDTTPAGHAWISPDASNACSVTQSPYLNNCGIDPEETFLSDFLGSLAPAATGALGGQMIEFDQNPFTPTDDANAIGLSNEGFAYVPQSCSSGATCGIVVALHGCSQNYDSVGTAFIDNSGLNEWADSNDLIVLYPQVSSSYPSNPYGCWDWWGYLGTYDTSYPIVGGAQMSAVVAMVDQLMGA